ncbi:MAG: hypothetical protein LBJ46_09100 [Planctomycetota bacterium]|nr:hypothetical protein [Planctomycetota bacterium]
MDEEAKSWFTTPLATLLFCGAVAIFLLGYIPEAKRARECEAKVEEARMRINELAMQEVRARQRIAELHAGDPIAIEEAIREVLRLGGRHDFLPRE